MEDVVDPSTFDHDMNFPWAVGNHGSCLFQGFVTLARLGASCLMGSSVHSMSLVSDANGRKLACTSLKKTCHTLGMLCPPGSACCLLTTNQLNANLSGWCQINQCPIACSSHFHDQDEMIEEWCQTNPKLVTEQQTVLSCPVSIALCPFNFGGGFHHGRDFRDPVAAPCSTRTGTESESFVTSHPGG